MATSRRGTRAAQDTVQVLAEDEPDLTGYADKPLTPKMQDYVTWLREATGLGSEIDERSAALGPTLYHYFQGSEFNKARTQERRDARAAAAEPSDNGDAPKRRGRPAKPATEPESAPASKPATGRGRGRPAGSGAKPATGSGRGRGRGKATAGTAPF